MDERRCRVCETTLSTPNAYCKAAGRSRSDVWADGLRYRDAMPATQPRAVATAIARADVDRIRRIAVIGVLLVPSGLLLGLALASGGFFPDAVSVAAVGVLVIFSARVMLSRTAITGVSRGVALVAAALIAFAIWALASGSWSGSAARATFEYDRVLLYTVVFVLIGSIGRSTARARVLLLSLAAVSVGISIAAVATWLLPDLLPVARDIPRSRLAWPTSYWNATGLIGALGLVWVYSLSASSSEPAAVRVAGAVAAPWAAAVVIFTASRGATAVALLGLVVSTAIIRSPATPGAIVAVGFAIAVSTAMSLAVTGLDVVAPAAHAVHAGHRTMILLFVVALAAGAIRMLLLRLDARIAAARAPRTRAQVRGALGVAGAAVLIAFLVLGGPKAVRTAAHKFAAGQASTGTLARQRLTQFGNDGRLDAWRVALDDGFLRHPIDGTGAGTYATLWTRYGRSSGRILNAHSLYLEELAELGILGGGVLIAVVVSILVALARRARGPGRAVWAALFAGALMWAVHAGVDWDWQMPAVTAWFFGAGGLALAGPVAWRERAAWPWARVALGLGCLLLVITPAAVWRSQTQIVKAVDDFQRGNCLAAQRAALASNSALGSRWDPFEVMSYCEAGEHQSSLALDAITAAEHRDPENWELRYSEALIRATAGRDPRPAARAALELYPHSPLTRAAVTAFSRGGPRQWRRFALSAPLPLPWTKQ